MHEQALDMSLTRELRALGCGRKVGRYTILRRVASGGMAEVYLARSRGVSGFEKKVAIKKILPQHSHNDRFVEMLLDEAKLTVPLAHPNIAQVFELGFDDTDYFIVMEYVDGPPLSKVMQRAEERGLATIPIEHAVHIMAEVTKGLDHAHRTTDARGTPLGIIHRDVSPQNILLSHHGDTKLIDFGIARAAGRANQTGVGIIKGKLRYLAPEIAAGDDPDARVDIFCCGILLFEMLTGRPAYAPRSDFEAIQLATEARIPAPRSVNPTIPPELDAIVARALARDRDERQPTARDLHADLRRFASRVHPGYVASDLSDFVGMLFAEEAQRDRRLDAHAERIAMRDLADEEIDEPTRVARNGLDGLDLARPASRYRELVTALHLRKEEEREAPSTGSSDRPIADEARAPTMLRREDPVLSRARVATLAQGEPVIRAVTPLAEPEHREGSASLSWPTDVDRPPRDAPSSSRAPPTTPRSIVFGTSIAAAIGVTLALFAWVLGPSDATDLRASARTNTTPGTSPIAPTLGSDASAELVIRVEPDVPIGLSFDGRDELAKEKTPITIARIDPDATHEVRVAADGYRTETLSVRLHEREKRELTLNLRVATGIIRVSEVRNGKVASSHGKIAVTHGTHEISGIPIGASVEVVVSRPGARPFRETVRVTSTDPIALHVPPLEHRPKGWLHVNSIPVSVVWIDGRKLGETPAKVSVEAGSHRVVLERPDGQKRSFVRDVNPGKITTLKFRW